MLGTLKKIYNVPVKSQNDWDIEKGWGVVVVISDSTAMKFFPVTTPAVLF